MSLLDELLKKVMEGNRAPVQSEIPGGLLSMLTQGNQNTSSPVDINSFINRPIPQMPGAPEPQQFQGSGLSKSIINNLLGEWFDDRKYNKDLERADSERQAAADELDQIYKSGLSGKDLYYALSKARSKTANDIAKKGLEPTDPDKAKIVEMGAPGREGMRQQALFDPMTKQLVPIGEPWKPSSGVTVNTGDQNTVIKDTEASNIVDAQGNAVKIPIGMTRQQAADKGYSYGKPPNESQGKSNAMYMVSQAITNQYTNLLKSGFDPTKVGISDVALGAAADANIPLVGAVIEGQANKNIDPVYQQYRQLQDTWIENFGRDKSGGAIVREEYPNWRRQYWPQQGDNSETVKQKAIARNEYEKGLLARGTMAPKQEVKPTVNKGTPDMPIGWTDELEAEYQRDMRGGK